MKSHFFDCLSFGELPFHAQIATLPQGNVFSWVKIGNDLAKWLRSQINDALHFNP
jgi:hypothetical protein